MTLILVGALTLLNTLSLLIVLWKLFFSSNFRKPNAPTNVAEILSDFQHMGCSLVRIDPGDVFLRSPKS